MKLYHVNTLQYLKNLSSLHDNHKLCLPHLIDTIVIRRLPKRLNNELFMEIPCLLSNNYQGMYSDKLKGLIKDYCVTDNIVVWGRTLSSPLQTWLVHYFYAKSFLYGIPKETNRYNPILIKLTEVDINIFEFIYYQLTNNPIPNETEFEIELLILKTFPTNCLEEFLDFFQECNKMLQKSKKYLYVELY